MRVALVALIVAGGCAQRRLEPRVTPPGLFSARVDLFRRFASELPSCPSRSTPSVDEVRARGFRPGDKVVVQGHLALRCLAVHEVEVVYEWPPGSQEDCAPARGIFWVLESAGRPPFVPPGGPGQHPSCAPFAAEMPDVILLQPTPLDLFTCDAEAAAVGAPGLTVEINGTGVFLPSRPNLPEPDRDREGRIALDVERICRVDTRATARGDLIPK